MSSLVDVNSIGVSQQVLDWMEVWRELQENDPTNNYRFLTLTLSSRRDAEYIVECIRIVLQQERIAQKMILCLQYGSISDEAITVFGQFLRETPCPLHALSLWTLPPRQFHRLLEALHTNRSVKELRIFNPKKDDDAASWIADLLRHKRDSMDVQFWDFCFLPFAQILPCLRGQSNLKRLVFCCCLSNDLLLFNDPESTQLFVDNVLLSPHTTIKTLTLCVVGVSTHNRPLMAGLHKNTTLFEMPRCYPDDEFRLFIDPILRRNRYLSLVHDMLLGTTSSTSTEETRPRSPLPRCSSSSIITIPPPCGLWPVVMSTVGLNGTQGATPVFTILRDRLATWIDPSLYQYHLQVNPPPPPPPPRRDVELETSGDSSSGNVSTAAAPLLSTKEQQQQQQGVVLLDKKHDMG